MDIHPSSASINSVQNKLKLPHNSLKLLLDELQDPDMTIYRPLEGGGGGQTLITNSFVLKTTLKRSENEASQIYNSLLEFTPQTMVLDSQEINDQINRRISEVENGISLGTRPILMMTFINEGQNLKEYLSMNPNDLEFVSSELARIAVKDLITGNTDRIFGIDGARVNMENILVPIKMGERISGERFILIDNDHKLSERYTQKVSKKFKSKNQLNNQIYTSVQEAIGMVIGLRNLGDISEHVNRGIMQAISDLRLILDKPKTESGDYDTFVLQNVSMLLDLYANS